MMEMKTSIGDYCGRNGIALQEKGAAR